jgi:hypothetical protein
MSRVSPYDTAPQLIERKETFLDMMVRATPGVDEYRFYGAATLNEAYGNPTGSGMPGIPVTQATSLFEVAANGQFRSPTLIKNKWGWYGENLSKQTRVAFDPWDYSTNPLTTLPGRDETWFLRVQERRLAASAPKAASAIVNLTAVVGAGDNLTIAGVIFTGTVGAGLPNLQQFQTNAGGAVAATALIATINDPASQALLLAAPPAGVTVTAIPGGSPDDVILVASVNTAVGDQITLVPAGGNIVVTSPTLTGGGDTFLSVNGPVDHGEPKLGSIYVAPPATFFSQPNPAITLSGTAPDGTGAVAGSVPPIHEDMQAPNPMHILLPRRTASCFINNVDVANTLLVSTGWGIPMVPITPAEDVIELGGGSRELVLAGLGGPAAFSVYGIIALGPGG